jgi:hypothetical protein
MECLHTGAKSEGVTTLLRQKVLDAYADGSPLSLIIESFNITYKQVEKILLDYKEDSKYKKSFTDDFKTMIAERDINGGKDITRSSIAKELQINPNTVKKACEQFGQSLKDKAVNEKAYTRLFGVFKISICPSCDSNKVNTVEDNIIYCLKCESEHIFKEDHVLKVNYEYIEE